MPDSFDYTTGTNSENVRLLQALIDEAPEYTEETNSRNANILKSIINNTEYTDAPQSEIEELLLRLKAKIGGEIEVDELNVTENGTYDAGVNKAYNPVTVELPLDSKTITENGTYTASDDNLAGFNEVTVAVEGYAKKSIENTPTSIATFNASALPMPSLTVGIEAVQSGSGDPSPTNVRPISGHTEANVNVSGVNVWDEETQNGYWNTVNGAYVSVSGQLCCKKYISVKPSITYYFHKGSTTNQSEIMMYDKDNNYIGYLNTNRCVNKSFETPSNCYFITFNLGSNYGTTYLEDISINYPSTDTSYEPYNGQTYTIDLGGTRYGCTLDVVSGVLTVDRVGVDLGTLTWNTLASGRHSTFISDGKFAPTNTDIANALSSQYIVSSAANMPNIDSSFCYGANGVANLLVNDSRYNGEDATAFKTHMNGVQLVYELQTPQTIQLTPTAVKSLLGTNNIWADSGDITVTALDRIIQG